MKRILLATIVSFFCLISTAQSSKQVKWTFTSTNKKLKAKSANALYKFSIKFPVFFFKEFYESFKINDPSIYEWMITVLYNTIIFILKNCKDDYESEIIKLSKFLSTEVLSRKGEYTTNNIVTRNYAFDILQLLVRKNKNVAKIIDLEKVKEEFKYCGVTKWKQVSDLNEGHKLAWLYFPGKIQFGFIIDQSIFKFVFYQ